MDLLFIRLSYSRVIKLNGVLIFVILATAQAEKLLVTQVPTTGGEPLHQVTVDSTARNTICLVDTNIPIGIIIRVKTSSGRLITPVDYSLLQIKDNGNITTPLLNGETILNHNRHRICSFKLNQDLPNSAHVTFHGRPGQAVKQIVNNAMECKDICTNSRWAAYSRFVDILEEVDGELLDGYAGSISLYLDTGCNEKMLHNVRNGGNLVQLSRFPHSSVTRCFQICKGSCA